MSPHARTVLRAKPFVVVASVLAFLLLAVPAALFATGSPWVTSDAAPAASGASGRDTSAVPTTAATPGSTAGSTPGSTAGPTAGSAAARTDGQRAAGPAGRTGHATSHRSQPPFADPGRAVRRQAQALRRQAQALLRTGLREVVPPGPLATTLTPTPTPTPAPLSPVPLTPAPLDPVQTVVPTTFRVSSFNVLGAAHTRPGGTRPEFAAGTTRMRWVMDLLRSADISVAGLQEFESPQHAAFQQAAPGWDVYPGTRLSRSSLANSIVWNSNTWQLVEGHTIDIPYFFGRLKPMPYLLLRNLETGREVWFANFHNPASVHGPAGRWRREAVARETVLVNRLAASGTPVVMTGDMNARTEFFCPLTTRSQMHAANGGSRGGRCTPPPTMGIDWILGSHGVTFSDHRAVRGGLVSRTTDHPFVWATATISGDSTR